MPSFGRSAALRRRQVWISIPQSYAPKVDKERFDLDWPATVVTIERTAPVVADSTPNQFIVTYRRFDAPLSKSASPSKVVNYWGSTGSVTRFTQTVRLRGSEHGPQIDGFVGSRRATPGKDEGKKPHFPWATFLVNTATRRGPSLDAELTPATDVRPGNGLRALCVWTDSSGRNWYRTYLGWANGDDLRLTQLPDEGILECATDGFGTIRAEP